MSLETLYQTRLVPVAVIHNADDAEPLAAALLEAGLPHIEVTLRTPCAMTAMERIIKAYPEMTVGAGTVIDSAILPELVDKGVRFGVAPGFNPKLINKALSLNFQMIPGVITPTEVELALSHGLKLLKFFPAEQAGGAAMLKALAGPYGHTGVQFVPTGGINAANAPDYLATPVTAAIGGSWFVSGALLEAGDFSAITRLTKEALALTAKN